MWLSQTHHPAAKVLEYKICHDPVNISGAHWDGVDPDIKALVLALLQKDPTVRLSAADLLQKNAWVRKNIAGESSRHFAREICQAADHKLHVSSLLQVKHIAALEQCCAICKCLFCVMPTYVLNSRLH